MQGTPVGTDFLCELGVVERSVFERIGDIQLCDGRHTLRDHEPEQRVQQLSLRRQLIGLCHDDLHLSRILKALCPIIVPAASII